MSPVNWLLERSRLCNPLRLPILLGISPDRAFFLKHSVCRLPHCPIESGIVPLIKLPDKSMAMTFFSWPMFSAIAPVSELCERFRMVLRLLIAKIDAGM